MKKGNGIFDNLNPPETDLIGECVHCGFCLPACPTYSLWGEEMDSPRGRIYLMKLGIEGRAEFSRTFVSHFDKCLGCMACMTACPSGVEYNKLIESTRAQIERNHRRSFSDWIYRKLIFNLFPYPNRLRAALFPLWFYQRSGLQRLFHSLGVNRILPKRLKAMESLLPQVSIDEGLDRLMERIPAKGERRLTVGLIEGCVQSVFFSKVNRATARVLSAEGCDVVVPENQSCCGALMVHSGEEGAADMARKTIDLWEKQSVDFIVTNAAGCGSTLKEYGHLLKNDSEYSDRAEKFAAKCRDISEVLASLTPRSERQPIRLRVALHYPCHLQHAQRVKEEPRIMLKTIPELEILEVPETEICCGSAGIYNLVQPDAADELGQRKVQNVLKTEANIVATANPGCLLQIGNGLKKRGVPLRVVHPIEILDASISGKPIK